MMDKVSAYSFGSVEVTVNAGDSVNDANNTTPLLLTHEAMVSCMQPMEAEILRLKSLCLVFAEKLAQLEPHLESIQPTNQSVDNNVPNNQSSISNRSHIQHSPSVVNHMGNKLSGSAGKRRLNEEDDNNNGDNDSHTHKKKRT